MFRRPGCFKAALRGGSGCRTTGKAGRAQPSCAPAYDFLRAARRACGVGLWDSIRGLFKGGGESAGGTLGVDELARRLGVGEAELRAIVPRYRSFTVNKRSGGQRRIEEPAADLKRVQRLILRQIGRA